MKQIPTASIKQRNEQFPRAQLQTNVLPFPVAAVEGDARDLKMSIPKILLLLKCFVSLQSRAGLPTHRKRRFQVMSKINLPQNEINNSAASTAQP